MKNAQVNKPPYNDGNPGSNFSGNLMNPNNSSPNFFGYNNDPPFIPQMLESATVEIILTPYFSYAPDIYQGLVWSLSDFAYLNHPFWGHGGGCLGVRTMMSYAPEKEVGLVLLTNGEGDIVDIHKAIREYGYEL